MLRKLLLTFSFTLPSLFLFAQSNWQLLSPQKNKRYGAAVEEAYKKLEGRNSKTVIVAVIDIGTDIDHEDLKQHIWTNPGEIAGNGIDDDHNGYIDDVHGWNFLGGKERDLMYEATEETRNYQRLKRYFATKDTAHLSTADSAQFVAYKKAKRTFNTQQRERENDARSMTTMYKLDHQWFWRQIFHMAGGKEVDRELAEAKETSVQSVTYNKIDVDSLRTAIIGDHPEDLYEQYYGNDHVKGTDPSHGTHTSGIIGAVRHNNIGIDGIADNVRIMVLRAVPWGDERDKDVANAIRYAADNGASIISMSFGKYYSPDKAVVDSAVQYAVAKDVLFVHSAGNESKNCDTVGSYPNSYKRSESIAGSWIEVGANGRKKGKKLIASFSNYGQHSVDIFAPGVNIYATLPGNKYGKESGTSMAGPVVAGVAAIVRSYFPEMKAAEVKSVLMQTVAHYNKKVRTPGHKKIKVKLDQLCISGGIVNAANAVDALIKK
jgi:cell wall-associated protease